VEPIRPRDRGAADVVIRLPPTLAERAGGATRVIVAPGNLRDCLDALVREHPDLARLIWLNPAEINPVMLLFVNDERVGAADLGRTLKAGDELDVVPAIEAG
jgi:molybdopterin converting factor small subunit